jgi:hypothetical protein
LQEEVKHLHLRVKVQLRNWEAHFGLLWDVWVKISNIKGFGKKRVRIGAEW